MRHNRHSAQHFAGHGQNHLEPRLIGFADNPRFLGRKIAVGLGHHAPDFTQNLVQGKILHQMTALFRQGIRQSQNGLVLRQQVLQLRCLAFEIFGNHRQRALRQIAEIIGEIGIDPRDNRFMRIVAVLPERDFTQEEITQLVDPVMRGQRERIDHIADRFGHFLAAVEQESMAEHAFRQRQTGRHQKGRPIDGVEPHDILADNMHIGRPEMLAFRLFVGKASGGQVIRQRVHPDIHHMLGIARYRNAPIKRGAAHREIFETGFDETGDFVAPLVRTDKIGMILIMFQQGLLKLRKAEEIAFLLHPFHRRALRASAHAIGADSGFGFGIIGLVAHRIPTGIGGQIDIARLLHPLPDRLTRQPVPLLGGADEVIIGGVEGLRHVFEVGGIAVGQRAHLDALFLGRLQHFLAVLVGAGQKKHIKTIQPLETGNRVRCNQLIGMADMGRTIGIGNGRGQIELRLRAHTHLVLSIIRSGCQRTTHCGGQIDK